MVAIGYYAVARFSKGYGVFIVEDRYALPIDVVAWYSTFKEAMNKCGDLNSERG